MQKLSIVFALVVLTLTLAACDSSKSSDEKVWCVASGEKVTPEFKREYPDLYISKAACDALKKAGG